MIRSAARPVLAAAPLVASRAMLTEAGLSFLGIGAMGEVSWEYLLHNAQPFLCDARWMRLFPGLAITSTVLVLGLTTLVGKEDIWKVLGLRAR